MWNYRVIKTLKKDGSIRFGIHEAYFEGSGWTENPIAPETYVEDGEDPSDDLRFVLDLRLMLDGMMLALDRPVIEDRSELENK